MRLRVEALELVIETDGYDSVGPDTELAEVLAWLRERGVPVRHDDRDTGTL